MDMSRMLFQIICVTLCYGGRPLNFWPIKELVLVTWFAVASVCSMFITTFFIFEFCWRWFNWIRHIDIEADNLNNSFLVLLQKQKDWIYIKPRNNQPTKVSHTLQKVQTWLLLPRHQHITELINSNILFTFLKISTYQKTLTWRSLKLMKVCFILRWLLSN